MKTLVESILSSNNSGVNYTWFGKLLKTLQSGSFSFIWDLDDKEISFFDPDTMELLGVLELLKLNRNLTTGFIRKGISNIGKINVYPLDLEVFDTRLTFLSNSKELFQLDLSKLAIKDMLKIFRKS